MPDTKARAVRIPLQVGAELRITNSGGISVDNPEIELADNRTAAEAVLYYHFDASSGVHVLRLLDPVADRAHMRVHRHED